MANFDAWRYYLRARLFDLLRRPDESEDAYRRALAADPHHARAAHALAFRLAGEGRFEEALERLDQVVRQAPRNTDAWYNKGYAHDKLHQYDAAIAAFSEATRLDPKHDVSWFGLGMALVSAHRLEEAADALLKAGMLQITNPHPWYQLGLTYHALHQPAKVQGVIEHLNRYKRHYARKLILECERSDLAYLVEDLIVD
jgi:tetratricopeptide (TPR) repeat protein